MFFTWHHIFAMLPAAANLFDPINCMNLRIIPSAGYSSCRKYKSPEHFYSSPLLCRQVVTEPAALKKLKIRKSSSINNYCCSYITAESVMAKIWCQGMNILHQDENLKILKENSI
jgi:hypothetical protein